MIRTGQAMLDVMGEREQLRHRVEGGKRVPVTIVGYLTSAENDDGESQEFIVEIVDCAIDGEEVEGNADLGPDGRGL